MNARVRLVVWLLAAGCCGSVAAPAQQPRPEIKLSSNWQQPDKKDDMSRELGLLLGRMAKAEIRLRPTETPVFWREFKFLTPVSDVAKAFGRMPGMRRSVSCPAFPKFSFFAHSLDVGLGEFSSMLLITDNANQLVGVQLLNESPRETVSFYSADDRARALGSYDFIQGGAKANKSWLVRTRVRKTNEVSGERISFDNWRGNEPGVDEAAGAGWLVQIDTELLRPFVSTSGSRSTSQFVVQRQVRLYLPQPIADIVLSRIQYQLR